MGHRTSSLILQYCKNNLDQLFWLNCFFIYYLLYCTSILYLLFIFFFIYEYRITFYSDTTIVWLALCTNYQNNHYEWLKLRYIVLHVNQLWHLAAKDFSILFLNIKALKTFSWWYVLLGCCVICCVTCNVKKLFILFIY